MVAQVLYRKWRPQKFEQVVGQGHIVQTLRNALASDDVAHAYLFAGPRGTGKTTTARLLAKAVNCLSRDSERPCNQCVICEAINDGRLLDLIEIDAASNRGIDEIRELRTKVNFSPTQTRYKVYILDEAHMLTNEAFNALLKTLEEPPGHVIFVLVTTEFHKLPSTITSRCQRFDFHRVPLADIIGELERIIELEGVSTSDAGEQAAQRKAVELIARSATGSLRDAISLLDQVITAGGHRVTLEQVQEALGVARMGAAGELVSHLIRGEVGPGLKLINQVINEGADPRQFTAQVVEYLHGLMLLRVGDLEPPMPVEVATRMREQATELSTRRILQALRLFNQAGQEIRGASPLHLPLELALVEAILSAGEGRKTVTSVSPVQPEAEAVPNAVTAIRETKPPAAAEAESPTSAPVQVRRVSGLARVQAAWPQILQHVRSRSVSVEALLKACEPVGVEEGRIILGFRYPFHRDKVEEQATRALIEEVVGSVLDGVHSIRCILADGTPTQASSSSALDGAGDSAYQGNDPGNETQSERAGGGDRLASVADDPVVQAMVNQYGARVVDVQ
jgi:DNA polymerase-3 subunit gamma/tau